MKNHGPAFRFPAPVALLALGLLLLPGAALAEQLAKDATAARERIAAESEAAKDHIRGIAEDITRDAFERLIGQAPEGDAVKSAVAASVEEQAS